MSAPTIVDFFGANVAHPNSIPLRIHERWDDSSTAAFSVVPAATETIYINYFNILTSNPDDSDLLKNNTQLRLFTTHVSPPVDPIDLIFDTFPDPGGAFGGNDLFSGALWASRFASCPNIWTANFKFSPPICLTGSNESFNWRAETSGGIPEGDALATDASISFSAQGWVLLTADL